MGKAGPRNPGVTSEFQRATTRRHGQTRQGSMSQIALIAGISGVVVLKVVNLQDAQAYR